MSLYLTPEILVSAYTQGYFPMADPGDGEIYWHTPDPRAIIPLVNVKVPRSLRQVVRKENFMFKIDSDFENVIKLCSQRDDTWINDEIIFAYTALHDMGLAHSVETYKDNPTFVDADMTDSSNIEELYASIQTLPATYQMVFNLYAIEDYSHKQIAEMLKISESTSKTQLFKARNLLQKKIQIFQSNKVLV